MRRSMRDNGLLYFGLFMFFLKNATKVLLFFDMCKYCPRNRIKIG